MKFGAIMGVGAGGGVQVVGDQPVGEDIQKSDTEWLQVGVYANDAVGGLTDEVDGPLAATIAVQQVAEEELGGAVVGRRVLLQGGPVVKLGVRVEEVAVYEGGIKGDGF